MVKNLTTEEFKEIVFNYTTNEDWKFKGTKPAIINYFSSWCQPCKTIAPILEELSTEYDHIDFYKINTEEQQELAAVFGIKSIPSVLFIPLENQPQLAVGALPKEMFEKAISEIINEKNDSVEDANVIEDKPEE
ncbi:MAG: thioredoxin domain-containing protein [Bacteroidales bacterium]|jgi:thioredoxin 1|nr:thioredoxin domain-containing protein [Bacteroidales bacterium]